MIVAVDFDGTLCENQYPYAGCPNYALLNVLRQLKDSGEIELIFWTCRVGEPLKFAVEWCKEHGIEFDAVNENLPRIIEQFGGDNHKIYADIYIDDLAVDFSIDTMKKYALLCGPDVQPVLIMNYIREKNNALRKD